MEKILLEELTAKTRALMEAPTCSAEAKAAARRWLDAVGTDAESEARESYIAELEEDIMPIDNLMAFAGSEEGANYFGAETAKEIAAHAADIKAAGGQYCDCPACTIVAEILAKKEMM